MIENNPNASIISLRNVEDQDLPIFFEQQLDPQANYMAAFTSKNPADRAAFDEHWTRILADPGIVIQTIVCEGHIAGYVLSHNWFGDLEITYWLGKPYWGRGIATRALAKFLEVQTNRPIYGRAVKDNIASIRVMEKCGFQKADEDKGFANARGTEVDEVIFVLTKK